MEKKRVIVTGGGASGLMAAIAAAENGAAVTILEQNEKPGKKICATGNGKCNFTNIQVPSDAYRSENPGFEQAVPEPGGGNLPSPDTRHKKFRQVRFLQ
jgi:predicted flavoprotein YhiN